MDKKKGALLLLIVALIASYFIFDLGQYFSLSYVQQQKADIEAYYQANPGKQQYSIWLLTLLSPAYLCPGRQS